ncbi:MAG: bifunctional 5,10-methylenetetrahydrofolate dehydrogenase/5,10-methenyltetrahydrofolate cyclohydrolase, partial [bacterium]|nr:bifunctional 5,10-methylenetetrahydrofolate dehydrogenase/5,10-methenyltetrahydrofolate cyclohydrolase [bacterium]
LVGDDPGSQVYVRMKEKDCEEVGIFTETKRLPEETLQQEVIDIVDSFNADEKIHGILVQHPLPGHMNEVEIFDRILPSKDADGFHPFNVGKLLIGERTFVACTPMGVLELLSRSGYSPEGKHAVIVGRSTIVGKPLAALLVQKDKTANATVTICHSRTQNLPEITRSADILIAAIGSPGFIKADMVREGVVVIDVGVNRIEDPSRKSGYRLVGDVDYDEVFEKAEAITPVPGGVGPMTRAMLLHNTTLSAEKTIK